MPKAKIESISPLTFMQSALLFHKLQAAKDQGFVRVTCKLTGDVDLDLLEEAWKWTIQRHPVMRTSIHWEKIKKPVQVVHPQVSFPWQVYDWREVSSNEFEAQFSDFAETEATKGLDFSKAPISRFHLFRKSDTEYRLLWSCHHILLDGWSASVIMEDAFAFYDARIKEQTLELGTPPTYQAYLQWRAAQDEEPARVFWKEQLKDFEPTLINPKSLPTSPTAKFQRHKLAISPEKTEAIKAISYKMGVSFNILIQALWSLVLSKHFGKEKISFGMTLSGRSGGFPDMELMADQFMNALPINVEIDPNLSLEKWLKSLQKKQGLVSRYEHVPINQIMTWIDWTGGVPMFDSLLVFQGLPWNELKSGNFVVSDLNGGTTSIHPLTVMVQNRNGLEFIIRYNDHLISEEWAFWLTQQLEKLLTAVQETISPSVDGVFAQLSAPIGIAPKGLNGKKKNSIEPSPNGTASYTNSIAETQLLQIWERVFKKGSIKVTDNFFEIGGTSILAIQIFALIESRLKKSIPPISLLANPTIQELAKLVIDENQPTHWSSLVPMQPNGIRPAFFAIHNVGGNIFTYRELCDHLGPNQPFYGLQARGLDGKEEAIADMGELAENYIQEIQRIQPQGPYLLGGNSFGGLMAYEISKKLTERGEEVALLALFDTLPTSGSDSILAYRVPAKYRLLERLDLQLGHVLMVGYRETWAYLVGKIKENVAKLFRPKGKKLFPGQKTTNEIYDANYKAAMNYTLEPYNGKITLFLANINYMRFYQDIRLNWHKFAKKGLEIHIVPGNHNSIMRAPNVETLAREVEACIDRVIEEQSRRDN